MSTQPAWRGDVGIWKVTELRIIAVDGTWVVWPAPIPPVFLAMVSWFSVNVVSFVERCVGSGTPTVTGIIELNSLDARTITAEKIMPYIESVSQRTIGGSALTTTGDS